MTTESLNSAAGKLPDAAAIKPATAVESVHTLGIVFRAGGQVNLIFKSEGEALQAIRVIKENHLDPEFVEIRDNFGTTTYLTPEDSPIAALVLQNTASALDGNGEIAIIQARGQMKAQQKAQRDPTLRFHIGGAMAGGPGGGPMGGGFKI